MKKLILGIVLLASMSTFSQEVKWFNDYNAAAKASIETNKPILANFTGSDWCGWCKKLSREVFVQDEFKTWANDNVILLTVDFPRRKKLPQAEQIQNQSLQKAFGVRGYPTIVLFEPGKGDDPKKNMKTLGQTGYVKGGPTKWISKVERFLPKK